LIYGLTFRAIAFSKNTLNLRPENEFVNLGSVMNGIPTVFAVRSQLGTRVIEY